MKNLFHTSTLFFLSLLTATAVSAGSYQVPFEFEAAGQMMPAGSYEIRSMSGAGSIYRLLNRESGKSILLSMPRPLREQNHKAPRAVFACREATCELKEVWPQSGVGVAAKVKQHEQSVR